MGRIRTALAAAAIGAALAAPVASAAEAPSTSPASSATTATPPPASTTSAPAPIVQGSRLEAPPALVKPAKQVGSGGTSVGGAAKRSKPGAPPQAKQPLPGASPAPALSIPSIPSSSCAAAGVPPVLVPIYERAAAAYGLGPQGPAVLAGINEVETAFGTDLNVSSAGAEGWMQFMPSTWETYGVDANGDGVKDPNNPEDAIFAAARYLKAAGMPQNTSGAIFAYNHASWYVAEVLANASCYAPDFGGRQQHSRLAAPKLKVLSCSAAPAWRREIPTAYLRAFQSAAARYGLGQRGVWALAAVARLESDFGRGMDRRELDRAGPLGLEPWEWRHYAVDGDNDGPDPPSRPGRLGSHPGPPDLVPRQPSRRPLRPQSGRVVRAGGAR